MGLRVGGAKLKNKGGHKFSRIVSAMIALLVFAVSFYLLRLESHTPADVFLPMNYRADTESEGGKDQETALISDDIMSTYYQGYTEQEGRPYTVRQDLLLSRLAYVNAPQGFRGEAEGTTLRDLCDEIERLLDNSTENDEPLLNRDRQELRAIASGIQEHTNLRELTIREYVEKPSGFAGYVLENKDEITITLRGTDDMTDTLDNFLLLPFNLSVQYADVRELLGKYDKKSVVHIWLTGHSKGGHNAIYAASMDDRCRATAFNAPGFGIFLTDTQHDGLDFGVNYVFNGDVTGFLLFHLERRVVLESTNLTEGGRHRLDNFFNVDELTVATKIKLISVVSEWVTQILWLSLLFLAGYGVLALVRRIISGHGGSGKSGEKGADA